MKKKLMLDKELIAADSSSILGGEPTNSCVCTVVTICPSQAGCTFSCIPWECTRATCPDDTE